MLTVTFVITDLHRGGSPLLLAALAPALVKRGLRVEVVSIAPKGEIAAILKKAGVRVISLEARSSRDWKVVPRFATYVQMRRPDVVCSVLVHANLLVALARPLVNHRFAWVQSIHTVQKKPAWHWWVQGIISGMADAVVAPSQAVIAKMQYHGPVPRPFVISNGIDVSRFRNALPVDNPPWPAAATVVGYVGRFDPVKRLDLLVRAVPLLPANLHLALVGYGSEEPRLQTLVRQLNLSNRVHFPGSITDPERWYKAFSLFCSPSAAEGFGLTLVEAAAAGLPVIACDTPAVRDTLSEATWLPRDPTAEEVARAILAAPLGHHSAPDSFDDRYSIAVMARRYDRCFADLSSR